VPGPDDVPDDPDPFADEVVAAMMREVAPDHEMTDATPIPEGTDAVYRVTAAGPGGSRDLVVKAAAFVSPEAFRVEPRLLALLDARTGVPVPSVVGRVDDHPDLPSPFFAMEYVADGEAREGEADALDADALARVARDAGRNLAALHDLASFDGFGQVRAARDAPARSPAIALPSGDGLAVADPGDSWRAKLTDTVHDRIDRVADGDRFADLAPDLRAWTDDRLPALAPRNVDPVLLHADYRLGNLLVDDSGGTVAVIDWGNVSTGHGVHDLALAEHYLSGRAPLGSDRRERIRAALFDGYGRDPRADDPDRYDAFLLAGQLDPLVWFDYWYRDLDADERDALADRFRGMVRSLL
jgi:aminoglycoside phosphotransferase (APT) family kinase protein